MNAFGIDPYLYSPEQFAKDNPVIWNMKHLADYNNVVGDFYSVSDPNDPLRGLYFVICPDQKHLDDIKDRGIAFLLRDKLQMSTQEMNPHYNIIPIPRPQLKNNFSLHNTIASSIQDSSVVKYSFAQYGYHIPMRLPKKSVENLHHFNNRRNNPAFSVQERNAYDAQYPRIVAEIYQMAAKYGETPEVLQVPKAKEVNHHVSEDFFIKHSLQTTYNVVTNHFLKYIEQHLELYPNFIYYREKKPYLKTKDLNENYEKNGIGRNLWKNYAGEEFYRIAYPTSQEDQFYSMLARFNCKDLDGQMATASLIRLSDDIDVRIVNLWDMPNINSLCMANHVDYAINYGEVEPVPDDTHMTILFRHQDLPMMDAIFERLATERRQWYPCNTKMVEEAKAHAPADYYNPYLTDAKGIDLMKVPMKTEEERKLAAEKLQWVLEDQKRTETPKQEDDPTDNRTGLSAAERQRRMHLWSQKDVSR